MIRFYILLFAMLAAAPLKAAEREWRVVSWNLGWHLSEDVAKQWIAACDAIYSLDPVKNEWVPGTTHREIKKGWDLDFRRNGKDTFDWNWFTTPPCNVFMVNYRNLPVTLDLYKKRYGQIKAFIADRLNADIYAFQEVNNIASVKAVMPNPDAFYYCGFDKPDLYKVQRMVIAWRKEMGAGIGPGMGCATEDSLSLRTTITNPDKNSVRPGLSVLIGHDDKMLRIMTVHLKSSCVSPLEFFGKLHEPVKGSSDPSACNIKQAQLEPMENWLELKSMYDNNPVPTLLMGDFNRNLAHEIAIITPSQVRKSNKDEGRSEPTEPYDKDFRASSLYGEVMDEVPGQTRMRLVETTCPLNATTDMLCKESKRRELLPSEIEILGEGSMLGCRNPVGLDHILANPFLNAASTAQKVPLGKFGSIFLDPNSPNKSALAISDHCPILSTIRW